MSWHHEVVPRIVAPTLAEHREQRRDALLEAASQMMRESGAITMAAVAERTGLSRSAVYEYYRSSADLIADVVVDEMAAWIDHTADALEQVTDPRDRIITWVNTSLDYIADGRHALVRAAGDVSLPPVRRAQVQAMHHELAAPVVGALSELSVARPHQLVAYIWGAVEAAARHIEAGRPADDELEAVTRFVLAGIDDSSAR